MPDLATGRAVEAALAAGEAALRDAGVETPRREAWALWRALTGRDLAAPWVLREQPVGAEAVGRFHEGVGRRAAGEPFEYVTGSAGFRLLDLVVDRRVLIPRPETEGLVQHVLEWCGSRTGAPDAVEIGVGSGCVVLSLAVEGAFRRLVGTDISRDALRVATANHRRLRPATPVAFRHGSLFEPVAGELFDVVVSNPPYLTGAELEEADRSVRAFEPREALVSEDGGMAHIAALCRGAAGHLRAGGLLALEIDARRAGPAMEAARRCGLNARVEPDLFGRSRYLLATRVG